MTLSQIKYVLLAGTLCLLDNTLSAQLVVNNGALIAIKNGAQVIVKTGAVSNTAGTIDNAGTFIIEDYFRNNDTATGGGGATALYRVGGNWENNAVFIADSSTVELYGSNQLITGTAVTEFHNLVLTGTGTKTQTIDARVNNLLALNDRELATQGNKMFVTNPHVSAITRTSGFVSSTGNGRLSRNMNMAATYLFPVGAPGGLRYRPIEIRTNNTLNNTFEVRMANVDATSEGYNRNTREPGICDINPLYYHLIGRTQGTDPVTITAFYDAATETDWSLLTHWQGQPRWERIPQAVLTPGSPFNAFSVVNYNNFTPEAFAFGILGPAIDSLVSKVKNATCFGSADGSVEIAIIDGTPPFNFLWSPGNQTTQNVFNLSPGTYTLNITDNNGCVNQYTFTVNQPPDILLSASTTPLTCAGNNTGAINLTVTNGVPGFTYQWSPGNQTTEDISGLDAGIYTVTVIDDNNCTKTASFTVTEPDQLIASIEAANVRCFGEQNGEATVNAVGGTPSYSYLWSTTPPQSTSSISNLPGGTYSVTVTDNNGCTSVQTVTITVPDPFTIKASNDTIIAVGYNANLSVLTTSGGTPDYTFEWLPADGLNTTSGASVIASPQQNTYYVVTARDANGCEFSDTIYVRVDVKLYDFPDGFSPNGSNVINQTFGIIASPSVELIEIKIFNRWGQLVFSGNGNNARWDGTFNGKLQPMDNYVWQAQVQLPDGTRENKQGNVILVW
jgi:gliding motility-associated-like protein